MESATTISVGNNINDAITEKRRPGRYTYLGNEPLILDGSLQGQKDVDRYPYPIGQQAYLGVISYVPSA